MDQQSILQQQYPLSPKKFLKKMISTTVGWIFLFVVVTGIVYLISANGATSLPSPLFAIASALAIVFFFVILYGWYVRAYIRQYFYDATDSYITIKKGVFAPAEIHVQYSKIQDVYVDQDILDRIMGLYDVHLASATAASGMEAHIDGVDRAAADGLKNLLLQKLQSGGSAAAVSSTVASNITPAPSMQPSEPITFAKEISSRTYPIGGMWFVQQMITWFFISLFYAALFSFYVFGKSKGMVSLNMTWIIFFGLFVVIYASHLIYFSLWRSTYSFEFLPDYIVTKKGIIAKNENHLPYRAVQDVSVSQSIIERMLGLATVRIENAAAAQVVGKRTVSSAILIPGQRIVQANEISDAIKHVALTKNSAQTGL